MYAKTISFAQIIKFSQNIKLKRGLPQLLPCVRPCSDAHPRLQDRILLNYTRIENAHKERKKTFDVLLCVEV